MRLQIGGTVFNSQECQKSKFKKNPQFDFVKYGKTNGTNAIELPRFHLNGHTIGFRPKAQKFELPCKRRVSLIYSGNGSVKRHHKYYSGQESSYTEWFSSK